MKDSDCWFAFGRESKCKDVDGVCIKDREKKCLPGAIPNWEICGDCEIIWGHCEKSGKSNTSILNSEIDKMDEEQAKTLLKSLIGKK